MLTTRVKRLLADRKSPVQIGIVGAGAMGRGILYQSTITQHVQCVAICDIELSRAISTLKELGQQFAVVSSLGELQDCVLTGKTAVCDDGRLLASAPSIDVLVEASSSIAEGASFVVDALSSGKHAVLMNAEIDLAFGPYFRDLAIQNEVVVTSCDGDQHGVLKNLIDDMNLWGFSTMMAGNIKGYLDRTANPISIVPEADKRRLDYKMCTAYTDGTKLNIEMSLIANGLGLKAITPGMLGPRASSVDEVLELFPFEEILQDGTGVVDYVLGANPGGGVFAVGHQDNDFQSFMLDYYKMGSGPFYVFYRPYHLCHIESIASIVLPELDRTALLEPTYGFCADTFAYAKKNLNAGEILDGIGGHCCYGLVENVQSQQRHPGLQICLADNVKVKRSISKDEPIMEADVEIDEQRPEWVLRRQALKGIEGSS
jgi:predicted homoserine dehydrogenase-like protein